MESSWKRVKRLLKLNYLRFRFNKTTVNIDASSSSLQRNGYTRFENEDSFPTVSEKTKSPGLSSTESRSSKGRDVKKEICAICLLKLKQGGGQALFEAECSHTFHFQCIVSNVKHGNSECPICRAKWKQVPFNAEQSQTISYHEEEPLDLDIQNQPASNIQQSCSYKTVDLKTYAEFSEVKRSASLEDFAILINLKALVEKKPTTHDPSESSNHPQVTRPLKSSHAPVDLVAVLDVSGSMGGTKLALLKRAMGFVIQNLGPSDRLCVISFSSSARCLFHLRRMTPSGQQAAIQAVNTLVSNGATNIGDGLQKAASIISERREKNPICSIILLSDGHDSYVVTSSDFPSKSRMDRKFTECNSLMPISFVRAESCQQTASIHTFGFGADHDSILLHWISDTSGGTFSFVETIGSIQDAFAQCIGGLLSVAVRDVRVCVECVDNDVLISSIKSGNYMGKVMDHGVKGTVDLGILYAEEERNILVFVNIPTGKENNSVLLKIGCTYSDCVTKESFSIIPVDVTIGRPEVAGTGAVSIEVDRERNRLRAAEVMGEARASAERGDLSEADSILEKYRKVLSETRSGSSEDSVGMALDTELFEMQVRMKSQKKYEASGRAYMLSGMSSHSWQRATARGDSTKRNSQLLNYRTPYMASMVERSQTFTAGSSSTALVRSAQSSQL
ncbi:Inter-alpha-trypsin inhibitor heavy chain H3 [Zostera marina]|uniref:Inter-alpha-trypsin inhibitor heavy chain H3 n=1 Tax=Zostera marina TaxID=29655 RepID=A0A0K9P4X4_ZOSMR|nr:Inter-alpha-trypsin inhibitor heavy chain H3 [Zostera marina]